MMKRILLSCVALASNVNMDAIAFNKVIIWGHKLHSHTHSYIHNAFYRAFQHLAYPTYWFDKNDRVKDFDFSNSLFITEWQVEEGMPLRDDCYYITHNCSVEKYQHLLEIGHCIRLQVYRKDHLAKSKGAVKIEPFIFWNVNDRELFMPWATDLLPYEIDIIKSQVPTITKSKDTIYWVGTLGYAGEGENMKQIQGFVDACKEAKVSFVQKAGRISSEDHIKFIQKSLMAPTLVGTIQKKEGYIPCRIFKNISYGQMGITNSKEVYELFNKKIIYNPDSYQLFFDAKKQLENTELVDVYELMDFVKNNHTYLNRIKTLIDFFDVIEHSIAG